MHNFARIEVLRANARKLVRIWYTKSFQKFQVSLSFRYKDIKLYKFICLFFYWKVESTALFIFYTTLLRVLKYFIVTWSPLRRYGPLISSPTDFSYFCRMSLTVFWYEIQKESGVIDLLRPLSTQSFLDIYAGNIRENFSKNVDNDW